MNRNPESVNTRPGIAGSVGARGRPKPGVSCHSTREPTVTMNSSFFSSLVAGTLHADAPEESKPSEAEPQEQEVAGEAETAQEEEEEEPEDVRFFF